ncbi:hypothetical protein VCSRO93_3791 [Vibrio cholerae]|nr:hypothetical protein VCSRO93_3791 [Vibrio cholerae]
MEVDNIKLYIDGRWELTDLNVLTRVYIQLYGLLYSLEALLRKSMELNQ